MGIDKNIGRLATQGYYILQQSRLKYMNQIRDILRKINEGIAFDEIEEKKETKKFDKKYADSNLDKLNSKLLLEGKMDKQTNEFIKQCLEIVNGGKETKEFDCPHCKEIFQVTDDFSGMKSIENQYKKLIARAIKQEPIYVEFLSKIRGVGPIHSANLVKIFGDCSKFSTLSRLRAYVGYGVNEDGKAPRKEKGKTLNFNHRARSLIYMISQNLMKQNKGIYRKKFEEYKKKQEEREFPEGYLKRMYGAKKEKKNGKGYKKEDTKLSKGHVNNRALRKAVKLLLAHFWEASRELAGLPHEKSYEEGVLEHTHIINWKEAIKLEGSFGITIIGLKSMSNM